MKNINRERFFISFMILASTSIFSYVVMLGYWDGVYSNNKFVHLIVHIFQWCYFIIAFPNVALYKLGLFQNIAGFLSGVFAGALFYSLLIEIVWIRYNKKNNHSE